MLHSNQEVYQLMQELGDRNIAERLVKARHCGHYSETRPGSFLAGSMAGRLVERIEEWLGKGLKRRGPKDNWIKLAKAFDEIGIEKAASLACRIVVDSLVAGRTTLTILRGRIKKLLYSEMQMSAVSKLAVKPFRYNKKYLRDHGTRNQKKASEIFAFLMSSIPEEQRIQVPEWDETLRDTMTQLLITFIVQSSGVVQMVKIPTKKGRLTPALEIKPATEDWITDAEVLARQVTPLNLPLLTPPADWQSPYEGGYPEDFQGRRPLLSSHQRSHIKAFERADCPAVYEAINVLQRTAWAINQPVLDVFRAVIHGRWDCDNLKIPVWGAEELPKRPEVDKDSPVYAVWRREFRQARERQSSNRTRALQCARISFLADVYAGSPIYFVHMLDFRGRAYPLGGGLQYQGDDRQRGVLRFDAGKEIGSQQAAEWFLIHGANCWGADKLSFEGRLSWVEENKNNIKATAADPLSFRWWTDADKPWQFLAWCFEAVGYFEKGLKHYSYIPIGMDGSNNGLQLYSLLLRDPVGGAATNCIPSDKPQDIYMEVAKKVNKRLAVIRHDLAAEPLHRKWADQLLSYWPEGLPRAAVKRPVMTLPYGAMHHTCQRYLSSWYHDEVRGKRLNPPPFPDMDAYDAMTWIGKLVWEEIGSTVIAAMSGMLWLRTVSDMCATKGVPVSWVSPSGFAVTQHYQQGRKKHIVFTLDRPVHIFIRQDTPKISTRKHRNGIAPNFIHSLDAALMVETVNRSYARGVECFMMIHDSFATHACDAPAMADTLRQCAVEMFSKNLLEDLRQQLMDQTGLELPECPQQGTLELTQLLQSKYFFA